MDMNSRPATVRAFAVALTILSSFVLVTACYYTYVGNAIALAIFWTLAVVGLFVTAASWGTDGDLRRAAVQAPPPPIELHNLVEVDYANLFRMSRVERLVVTLRREMPFVTIEAIQDGWRNEWIVEGESMFEAYVKAWIKTKEVDHASGS